MKNLIFVISIMFIYGCNTNPNYERNLATAKKLFELHGKEDIDGQLALISDKIQSNSSLYGSETAGYDQYVNMLKGYHAAFDNVRDELKNIIDIERLHRKMAMKMMNPGDFLSLDSGYD